MSATASPKPKRRPSTSARRPRARNLESVFDTPVPAPKEKVVSEASGNLVEAMLEDTIIRIQGSHQPNILLRKEAEQLVDTLEAEAPDELLAYFRTHAVALMREQLQLRLAAIRNRERRSVFGSEPSRSDRQIDDVPRPDPFSIRYAVNGNVWRQVGDMVRSDWQFIAENRSDNAINSLFEISLAKRMINRLPDDSTPTRAVVSEKELDSLTRAARKQAESAVSRFHRQ